MGWLSSVIPPPADAAGARAGAGATTEIRPTSIDGYKAPDRNERALCWEARDAFFACLDQHAIINSIKEADKAGRECSVTLRRFEQDCSSSWVTYFKKRRVMEHQREATIRRLQKEGADVDVPLAGSGGVRVGATDGKT